MEGALSRGPGSSSLSFLRGQADPRHVNSLTKSLLGVNFSDEQ